MAVIAQNTLASAGVNPVVKTVLADGDTLPYVKGSSQRLFIENNTGASITVNIDGAGGTTVPVPNTQATFSVASGLDVVVADGTTVFVTLDTVSAYLEGIVSLTGGAGALVYLVK